MTDAEQTEFQIRKAALRAILAELRQDERLPDDLVCVPRPHLAAVIATAEEAIEAPTVRAGSAEPWVEASARLLYAEALLNGFKAMMEQRRTGPFAEHLSCADAVVANGYHVAIGRAVALGTLPPGAAAARLHPLCRFDDGVDPTPHTGQVAHRAVHHDTLPEAAADVIRAFRWATLQAGDWEVDDYLLGLKERDRSIARLDAALGRHREWPFPVLALPPHYLVQPVFLCTLLHDIGRRIDHELGISGRVGARIVSLAREAVRDEQWVRSAPTFIADLFGLALGGPGFIYALAHAAAATPAKEPDPLYPAMPLRVALLLAALRPMGILLSPRERVRLGDRIRDALGEHERPYVRRAHRIMRWLLGLPVGETRLVELLRLQGCDLAWARLPGDLLMGSIRRGSALPFRAGDAFLAQAHTLERADWQRSPDWYAHDRQRVPILAPTFRAHPDGVLKVPPVELMVAHDEMDFVGATNGRLAATLEEAARRREEPWKRVTIYFLDDRHLEWLGTPERPTWVLIQEKDQALKDLRAVIAAHPDTAWELRRFDRPTLFASFWWRDGRLMRVHTSACVWGGDIQKAPSTDYRYVAGYPNPELEELEAGLGRLRDEVSGVLG
ncbi:MAG: hypothetical protein ABIO70_05775 [Pseudomonadota bacterium]